MTYQVRRDFVGYGANPPDPQWPGGAKLAVNFVMNYEEGSEPSFELGDGRSEAGLTEAHPVSQVRSGRDLAAESMFEYGSRIGVWRLMRLFQERGLPMTVFGCALALERNPEAAAAIRAAGYDMPISKIITMTGVATLVLAPFGGYALNLSAITAAICMGEEAHADKGKRYTAAVACGAFYVLVGLFGAAVTGVLTAFPKELVAAIAGLALLATIGNGLVTAVKEEAHREPAVITFLVTLSGVTLWGIGSAFWGVVAGALALLVAQWGRRSAGGQGGAR